MSKDIAVISFYDRTFLEDDPYCVPVAYPKDMLVFYSQTDDVAYYDVLEARGYTLESFFADNDDVVKFILSCVDKGIAKLICQCEFGQSRSSGAAAAITEFFNQNGAKIFEDKRYAPNQIIYDKLLNSLVTQNFIRQIGF